jgi:hypothetical protein
MVAYRILNFAAGWKRQMTLAALGVGRHAVPGLGLELRGGRPAQGVGALRQRAIRCLHLRDLCPRLTLALGGGAASAAARLACRSRTAASSSSLKTFEALGPEV